MQVTDNRAQQRFELETAGEIAFAVYERSGGTIVFTHTIVPPPLEGHGVGSRLIAGALAQVRGAGLKVVPQCAFVAAYLERHPEAAEIA